MSTQEKISKLLKDNKIVLFMKGSPDFPMCGFSNLATKILKEHNTKYEHVNVLEDEEVRQGIKEFGQWPTIPQLYVNGELIGGSDIMMAMHDSGELAQALQ